MLTPSSAERMENGTAIFRRSIPFSNGSRWEIDVSPRLKIAYLVLGLIYKLVLDYAFAFPLQDFMNGAAFYAVDPVGWRLALSYIVTIVLLVLMPHRNGASSLVMQLGLFFIVLPLVSVYGLTDGSTLFFAVSVISFALAEIVFSTAFLARDTLDYGRLPKFNRALMAIALLLLVYVLVSLLSSKGLPSLLALDLSQVYTVRAQAGMSGLLASICPPVAKGVIPFLLAVGWMRKSPVLITVSLIGGLLIYLWTGSKVYLFMMPAILVVLALYRKDSNFMICFLYVAFIIVSVALYFAYDITGQTLLFWPFTLFVRRVLFIPAALKFDYFEYFSGDYGFTRFAGTFLSSFDFGPEVLSGYQYEIGGLYMGSYATYANTGMFGAEMASFGLPGVPFASLFFLLFAVVVHVAANRSGDTYAAALALPLLIAFPNAGVFHTMLHAYGLMMMAFMVFNVERDEKGRRSTSSCDT